MGQVAVVLAAALGLTVGFAAPASAAFFSCDAVLTTWPTGFQVLITLHNDPTPVNEWWVTWHWTGATAVTSGWGGNFSQSGTGMLVTSTSWNSAVPPNSGVNFGFVATGSPDHGVITVYPPGAPMTCNGW